MIDKFLNINSIDPNYWGKSGWIFLNSIALTYKPEYKESYKEFILKLQCTFKEIINNIRQISSTNELDRFNTLN